MKPNHHQSIILATLIAVIIGTLGLLTLPALVQAGPDLPPRNPPGKPQADDDDDGDRAAPIGAYIVLRSQAGSWAVVQWVDSAGAWHNVEGWQSSLGPGTGKRWWVDAKDFGKGPFRWVVTDGPGGAMVGASRSFNLPAAANQTVMVTVTAP